MRILIVTPWFPHEPNAVMGNFIYHSAKALLKQGVAVSVLVTRPLVPKIIGQINPEWRRPKIDVQKFESSLNVQVVHYPSIPKNVLSQLSGPLYRLGTEFAIRRLIYRFKPDLVHVHTELPGYGLVRLCRRLRIPVVLSLHGINTCNRLLNTLSKRASLRKTLNNASRVVLVGEPLRGFFSEIAGRDDHFRVVPNGFFAPPSLPNENRWQGSIRIVSVSNLHKGKGVDLSLAALSQLNDSGFTNWTYMIIGGGSEEVHLKRLVSSYNLHNKVLFVGRLAHDKVLESLSQADLFLLPSYQEAFGIVYLEAMALGLLTIGVQGQGPEAFIADGKTGFLVPPHDVQSITSKLKYIYEHKEFAKEISEAGKRFVQQNFTWECHAQKLIGTFDEILQK